MANYFDFILQNCGLSHITVKIFKELELEDLAECVEVSEPWCQFINENISITEHKNASLHHACSSGNVKLAKFLLNIGFNVNVRDQYNYTPLHVACMLGCDEIVELLCKQPSIDVNVRNCWGETPLHHACNYGHDKIVTLLCKQPSIDINVRDDFKQTPVHYACENGHFEIIELLCKQPSINVNVRDDFEQTPLEIACRNGHDKVVALLRKQSYRIRCNRGCGFYFSWGLFSGSL